MRVFNKKRFIPLLMALLLIVIIAVPATSMAAQPTVNLGSTSGFAVLAGSTITNTGTTIISGSAGGDVGLYPGKDFTGQTSTSMSGLVYLGADPVAIAAKTDLVTAYDDAAGRTPTTTIATELGGQTLTPGTYVSDSTTFEITGTLTLDAQGDPEGVFVFKTASTLITYDGSNVNLINNARFCRTFWQVGSSATLGTNSHFVGHIFALKSITANTGATVQGQLLARNGAVTLNNNTITNGICETVPAQANLHVIKHVINDSGRTAVAADFNLHVKISGIDVAASPARGAESPGTTYTLAAGAYVISEDSFAGYSASFSGDSTDGNIILAPGDTKTITITNNDIPTSPTPSTPPRDNNDGPSPVSSPQINVTKTPSPLALTSGRGLVTYTYKVTNPGKVALSNVSVTDDKVSPVDYVSGDVNTDNLLQPNEMWIYTAEMILNATTTNTATAKGSANGKTATDTVLATVVVTPPTPAVTPPTSTVTPPTPAVTPPTPTVTPPTPTVTPPEVVTKTVTGGQLPNTSTPWYNILLVGTALVLIGAVGWRARKRYE